MRRMPAPRLITARFYQPGHYRPEQSVGYLMRKVMASFIAQADSQLQAYDLTFAGI